MSGAFPGLGFDPAPGDPEQVRRCAREHARAATELDGLATALGEVGAGSASWRGTAATAFSASLALLTAHLRTAADSFGTIAAQLTSWATELKELQARARREECAAEAALDRLRAAHARAATVTGAWVSFGLPPLDAADAQEELRRITVRAEDVHATWRAACRRLASAVEAAADAAPPLPRDLGEFVWDHRVAVARTASTASFLSLPSALIPVAGPVVSGALSAVALAGYSALAVHAEGSTVDVALGAAGVGLGGGAALASRAAAGPAAGAAWSVVSRGLGYGEDGTWLVSTGRGLVGLPAPKPPPPPSPRRSVPALRRLLVAPVMGPPGRRRR